MWPRWLEVAIALWLGAAPFVVGAGSRDTTLLAHDLGVAALVAGLALGSLKRRWSGLHLVTLGVALWLIGFGWVRFEQEPLAVAQNHMLLGLTLLMTGVLPSDALRPPLAWRRSWGETDEST